MKKFLSVFFLRGLVAAGFGPIVLAIIYGVLGANGVVEYFTPHEITLGILTVTLLAFMVGGLNAIYTLEKLPLASAILVHGAGLYVTYITIYLINGWIRHQAVPILIFTTVFIVGYAVIWCLIYLFTKKKTKFLNQKLENFTK